MAATDSGRDRNGDGTSARATTRATGRTTGAGQPGTMPGTTGSAGTVARSPAGPTGRRAAGFEHAVVEVVTVVMPEDYGAGEEDDRQDEKDPGDDHDPRRGRVEPGRLGPLRRRRAEVGSRGDGSRLGRGFGRFSHALNIA